MGGAGVRGCRGRRPGWVSLMVEAGGVLGFRGVGEEGRPYVVDPVAEEYTEGVVPLVERAKSAADGFGRHFGAIYGTSTTDE